MHFSDFPVDPVVVDLLVRTAGDAHPPAAAPVLVDQDDAVLLALVDRARGAGGHAGGVEAVLADPRQVHHEGFFELAVDLLLTPSKLGPGERLANSPPRIVLPVRSPLESFHRLAADQRFAAAAVGNVVPRGDVMQVLVVVGERLVVVVDYGQSGIGEDVRSSSPCGRRRATESAALLYASSRRSNAPGSPSPWDSRCPAWFRRC